jgi:hypothetical protein
MSSEMVASVRMARESILRWQRRKQDDGTAETRRRQRGMYLRIIVRICADFSCVNSSCDSRDLSDECLSRERKYWKWLTAIVGRRVARGQFPLPL